MDRRWLTVHRQVAGGSWRMLAEAGSVPEVVCDGARKDAFDGAGAGVHAHVVEIEADIENGLPALFLIGLPDTALREARDRIRSAIVNIGGSWPLRRVTVGLSPASPPRRGPAFDVASMNQATVKCSTGCGRNSLTKVHPLARFRTSMPDSESAPQAEVDN